VRRADRLFQLVQTLRARRFATGDGLAAILGVSTRTVYRDVRDLQSAGVPIRGEAGVGYRMERGFELPPLTFSAEELEGLALGARMVGAWGDPDLGSAVSTAMTKIEAVIPEALRPVLLEAPLFAPGSEWAQTTARHMGPLRRAIGEGRYVHFAYTREDGEQSERDVAPLGLYYWGRKWTLAAWCDLRGDYRSFRPDRMRDVVLLERGFDRATGPSLAEFLARVEAAGAGEAGAPAPRWNTF
jgi:predicted DNA-binding transcriptional regulator YafY